MKFSCHVTINLPRDQVVELWKDPKHLKEWQDTFLRMEHVSGQPETPGAKTKLYYAFRKGEFELEETIRVFNLPEEMTGYYKHKKMENTMQNLFLELGPKQTKWVANIEYTIFRGFMTKLVAFMFPGMFKKQTLKWMVQFKEFAERKAAGH